MAAIAVLLAACGPTTLHAPAPPGDTSPMPAATPSPAPTVAASVVAAICAPPAFASCSHDLQLGLTNEWESGDLLAVCDYGNGTGAVLWVDSGKEADAEVICSGDGLGSPRRVVRVVRLP
jgi:hypothetical protein